MVAIFSDTLTDLHMLGYIQTLILSPPISIGPTRNGLQCEILFAISGH